MGFLAQLLGAVLGAIAGFALGQMVVFGVAGETLNLGAIMGGVGALVGFMIGRFFTNRYESEASESGDAS